MCKGIVGLIFLLFLTIVSVGLYELGESIFSITCNAPNSSIKGVAITQTKVDEMLLPTVKISTGWVYGSGVIIGKNEKNEYLAITNSHVVAFRFTKTIEIDGIRGIAEESIEDTGVTVSVFEENNNFYTEYIGEVIKESQEFDLALIKFKAEDNLNVANTPGEEIINNISVFDEVFTVGCQMFQLPIANKGILSSIIQDEYGKMFINDAHISPGSSGGGLFKKVDGHYYLIGIQFRTGVSGFQLMPHLAHAISIDDILIFLRN